MWLLVLLRTVAIFLATNASVSLSSSPRQDENSINSSDKSPSKPASTTDVIITRARNLSDLPKRNNSLIEDKNNEARTFPRPIFSPREGEEIVNEIGTLIKKLKGQYRALNRSQKSSTHEDELVLDKSINFVDWIQSTDRVVADPVRSAELSQQLLQAGVSPELTFTYMGLEQQLYPEGLIYPSLKLRWWLNYIESYRGQSSTSTSHVAFSNEELLTFLEEKIPQQPHLWATSLTLDPFGSKLVHWRESVAMLFEVCRRYPNLRSFAVSMQVSMSSIPAYAEPVQRFWLEGGVSPTDLFAILRLNDYPNQIHENNAMFIAWIRYVPFYWKRLDLANVEHFEYNIFADLLSAIGKSRCEEILESSHLGQMIGDEAQDMLYAVWRRMVWLNDMVEPQAVFDKLNLTGKKIRPDSFDFVQGMKYIARYRERETFTDTQLLDLLKSSNSIDEIARLFVGLARVQELHELAQNMLRSITRDMAPFLPPENMNPKDHWRSLFPDGFDSTESPELLLWFRCAFTYYEFTKRKSPDDALAKVNRDLYNLIPNRSEATMQVIMDNPEVKNFLARVLQNEESSTHRSTSTSSTRYKYTRYSSEPSVGN